VLWLKPFLGGILAPLPVGLALVALGLWLRWRGQRPRLGRILLALGIAIPLLASNNGLGHVLIRQLEDQYPPAYHLPITPSPVTLDFIAVLGGGHAENEQLLWTSRLQNSSRARLVEAVRLAYLHPSATLLVCGPIGKRKINSHAQTLAEAAAELGVNPLRIRVLSQVHDTHDEVLAIKSVSNEGSVGLVTSAWHMPRAMGLGLKAGIRATACPADYRSPHAQLSLRDWLGFSSYGLESTTRTIREYLGLTWTAIRGQR